MEVEPQPAAPAVVAVVVTCDPGSWFELVLTSLAGQDYPNLSVLVIDAASHEDPGARVAAVLPGAYVTRLERQVGFGRAANEALKQVDGASHLLFCHDDVVLAPDAVRCLLEEAFRSNAGIATPKYVQWDHPERLAGGRGHGRQGGSGPGSGRARRAGPGAARQRARSPGGAGWGHAGANRPVPGHRRVQRHHRPVRRGSRPLVAGPGGGRPGGGGSRRPGAASGGRPSGHTTGMGQVQPVDNEPIGSATSTACAPF